MDDDIERLMRASRPAHVRRDDPLPTAALGLLDRIQAGGTHVAPRSRRARGTSLRRRWMSLTGGGMALVVALLAVVLVVTQRPTTAYALTPPLLSVTPVAGDASALLEELSDVRKRHGGTNAVRDGEVVRSYEWSLNTLVNGSDAPVSSVVPSVYERTFAPGGEASLRILAGEPFRGQQTNVAPAPGTVLEDSGAPVDPRLLGWLFLDEPPVDPELVEAYLRDQLGLDELSPGERLSGITALLRERVVTAEQEAALLGFLVREGGWRLDGKTTDRLGRDGIVLSAPGDDPRYRESLIVSPETGEVLAWERVYIGGDREDIPTPSVVAYTAWER